MEFKEYQKYRWFITSSGKLVVGGKNSLQNDELLKKLKRSKKDYLVMHTSSPGSPFSIILSKTEPIKNDIEQTAIFTASFSRAWRNQRKKQEVHIFRLFQLYKGKSMKQGTWGINGGIKKISVVLELVLTKQNDKLRAVPEKAIKSNKSILLKIAPGKIDKQQMASKLQSLLKETVSQEEILSALPPGGIRILK